MFARYGSLSLAFAVVVVAAAFASGEELWPPDSVLSRSSEPWIRTRIASDPRETAARAGSRTNGAAAEAGASEAGEASEGPETEGPEGAEEEDEIETDRDSFTPATTTVGRGRIVFESAYTFTDNRSTPETHSFPEFLTRIGVSEHLELRVGWNYEIGGAGNSASNSAAGSGDSFPGLPGAGALGPTEEPDRIERESHIFYGAKLGLTEQKGLFPESAVIFQGFTPTSGPSNTTTFAGTYVLGWKLLSDCKLDAAVRYATAEEEGDRFGNFAPSVVLKVPVAERWTAHAEWFGIFADHRRKDSDTEYFSPGIHYLVTPDFEVGVRVGWGLTDQSAKFFCNSGVGLRF